MSFNGEYNPKEPSIKYHSFQFFKYHSFKGHTANNFPKIFYGRDINSRMVRIIKYLKKNGYVTCLSNSECYRESNLEIEKGDKFISFLLLKTVISSYQFEYGNQFWRQYINNRKFLFIINKLSIF